MGEGEDASAHAGHATLPFVSGCALMTHNLLVLKKYSVFMGGRGEFRLV